MTSIPFADGLKLPLDAVTQTFAFLARKGAGKTYGASKLAEGMLDADAQVVVIDPVGVWYGLRLGAEGKTPGFNIPVFGGLHGDLPLEPTAGALVADLVVDQGTSLVLDVSMFRKNDRKRFVTDFAEQLFHRKKGKRTPMHLFVEEAQVFVPQRTMGDEARMLGAFEDLVKLGRNFGIGVTLISQRPQAVNKDALNQTECLVVLQTNGAQERKAIREWIIEQGLDVAELVDSLPSLQRGEAWVWSPSWLRKTVRVHIQEKQTFNASATPEVGKKQKEPRQLEPIDLEQIREAMAATVKQAEANDPKALRAKVAKLEAQLAKKSEAVPERVRIEKVEIQVLDENLVAKLERALDAWREHTTHLHQTGQDLEHSLQAVKRSLLEPARYVRDALGAPLAKPGAARENMIKALKSLREPSGDAPSAYALQLLETVASRMPMRPTRSQLAILANRSSRSSAYSGAVAELLKKGFLLEQRGQLEPSPEGLALVGHVTRAPTSPEEVRRNWLQALPAYEALLLRSLIDVWPKALSRADLSRASGKSLTSSAFSGAISTLKKNGLVDDDGELRASETLFLSGAA